MPRYYVVLYRGGMRDESQLRAEVEATLNEQAQRGWVFDRFVSGDAAEGLGFSKGNALIIFRRNE